MFLGLALYYYHRNKRPICIISVIKSGVDYFRFGKELVKVQVRVGIKLGIITRHGNRYRYDVMTTDIITVTRTRLMMCIFPVMTHDNGNLPMMRCHDVMICDFAP